MDQVIRQNESFEELQCLYSTLKDSNEKLEAYADILESILKYYGISYPSYVLPDLIKFWEEIIK